MRQMLFGISLILFGAVCIMVAWMAEWTVIDIVGLGLVIIGMLFSIAGFVLEGKADTRKMS